MRLTIDGDSLRERLYALELSLIVDNTLAPDQIDMLIKQLDRVDRLITELETETAP